MTPTTNRWIKALLLSLVTLGLLGPGVWILYRDGLAGSSARLGLALTGFGVLFLLTTVTSVVASLRQSAANDALQTAEVDVDPVLVEPGDRTEVTVELTPDAPTDVDGLKVRLVGWEIIEQPHYYRGTSRKRVNAVDRPLDFDADEATRALAAGEPTTIGATATIPEEPESLIGQEGPLNWEVRCSVDIAGAGRLRRRVEITVDGGGL